MLSAIGLVYLKQDRKGQRDYWWRVIDFKRIRGKWYTAIFLMALALAGLSTLIDFLSTGEVIQLEAAAQFLDQPLMIIPYVISVLFFGPVPEELGWRGYALDRLQIRFNALVSSLILGIIWAVWHLPLFFIEGSYQYNLGLGTLSFWIFMGNIVPQAVLITWIYNNTNRSIMSAILFHFMINLVGELFELTEVAEIYQFILWLTMAIFIVVIWGPKKLRRGGIGVSGNELL
jgi:membrane protease YdiL (CAAX protease family)